jgi:hypothetical protein
MRLPKGDRCGTPLRRLFQGRQLVAGGVDGEKLCTTLLLSLLPPPLVLRHESSESDRASLSAARSFLFPPMTTMSFFLGR